MSSSTPNLSRSQSSINQRRSGSWRVGEKKQGSQIISHHSSSNSEGSYPVHFTKPELPKNKSYAGLPMFFKPAATPATPTTASESSEGGWTSSGAPTLLKRDKSIDTIQQDNKSGGGSTIFFRAEAPSSSLATRLIPRAEPPSPTPAPFSSLGSDSFFLTNYLSSSSPTTSSLRKENTLGTYSKSPNMTRREVSSVSSISTSPPSTSPIVSPNHQQPPPPLLNPLNSTFNIITAPETSTSSRPRKKDEVDGLMERVWGECYKEGELFVKGVNLFSSSFSTTFPVVETNVPNPRLLQDTEMLLNVGTKTFSNRWGQDFLVYAFFLYS